MKGGLSKLGTTLIIIFVISMVALLAELVYVICRRRAFRRRTSTSTGDHLSQFSSSDSAPSSMASSKELLYFFCIRSQPRLDHTSSIVERSPDVEVIDIDLMKIQGVFGPPRFLFTIKEEEKEGFESPAGGVGRMSLEECFKKKVGVEEEEEEEAVVIEVGGGGGGGEDATPFSTPCASPVYFTPSDSPVHEVVVNVESTGESRISGTAASRRVEV